MIGIEIGAERIHGTVRTTKAMAIPVIRTAIDKELAMEIMANLLDNLETAGTGIMGTEINNGNLTSHIQVPTMEINTAQDAIGTSII